jgi:hypothetical protein
MYSLIEMTIQFHSRPLVGLLFFTLVLNRAASAAQETSPPPSQVEAKAHAGSTSRSDEEDKHKNEDQSQEGKIDQITAVPNRPTFSTTAESVQRGVLEVEYGTELADGHQNINGLIKFGLFKNLELRFANNPFERDAGTAGVGDSGAGFKYRLISQAGRLPTFSILYTATIPTSTGPPGIGAMGHSVDLLASKDFGKHHLDFNEGLHLLGRRSQTGYDRSYFTALDYSHPLPGKWSWAIEIAGFSRANPALAATMTLLLTAGYNVSSRLVLDVGEYTALYGQLPRETFFAGVTYSIADLYRRHPATSAINQRP